MQPTKGDVRMKTKIFAIFSNSGREENTKSVKSTQICLYQNKDLICQYCQNSVILNQYTSEIYYDTV